MDYYFFFFCFSYACFLVFRAVFSVALPQVFPLSLPSPSLLFHALPRACSSRHARLQSCCLVKRVSYGLQTAILKLPAMLGGTECMPVKLSPPRYPTHHFALGKKKEKENERDLDAKCYGVRLMIVPVEELSGLQSRQTSNFSFSGKPN